MSETPPTPISNAAPLPRAKSHVGRLLMLVPAIAMLSIGLWTWKNPPPGGTVQSIRLATKAGLSGEARNAYDTVDPGTPDLYLIVKRRNDEPDITLPPFDDTPIGNGLTYSLPRATELSTIAQVSVWDRNTLRSDTQLDRIELDGTTWSAAGQTFQVDLYGIRRQPPDWALPIAAVGGVLGAIVLFRLVWDQAL